MTRAAELFGITEQTAGMVTLIRIDPETAATEALCSFEVGDVIVSGTTFHPPTGSFLIITGGLGNTSSLIILDPATLSSSEFPIVGLPAGEEQASGIEYQLAEDRILITFGATATVFQTRIAEIDLSGNVLNVTADLGVGDRDFIAENSSTGELFVIDLNGDAPRVATVTGLFSTPTVTGVATPPSDGTLFDVAISSDTGEIFTSRLVSNELFRVDGNTYVSVGEFGCPAGIQMLTFASNVVCGASAPCVAAPADLVGWWPGDGNPDDIVGDNHGTLVNGTSCGAGMVGGAFSLDGVNDYVRIDNAPSLNVIDNFTVDAWILPTTFGGSNRAIFSHGNSCFLPRSWDFALGGTEALAGKVFVNYSLDGAVGNFVASTATVPLNSWSHVAFTFDAGLVSLFIDGQAAGSQHIGGNLFQNTADIRIGASHCNSQSFAGLIDEVEFFTRTLTAAEVQSIFEAGAAGKCKGPQIGSVGGQVVANCPTDGTGLLGVTVDAYAVGGGLAGSDTTDVAGAYSITDLPAGEYDITIVTPIGYSVAAEEQRVMVVGGDPVPVDFSLTCRNIAPAQRSKGFWKHQFGVATGGKGRAQVEPDTLCVYLNQIEDHFNNNDLNQVVIYQPAVPGACDLDIAADLLNLKGNISMEARAQQQLMALLLNVASERLSLTELISADDRTVSQAITYCDNLLDDPMGDYERAKTIADEINNGREVAAGLIPFDTANIAYKGRAPTAAAFSLSQNVPNPFNPRTTIRLALPMASDYTLTIYDIAGRFVRQYRGVAGPGEVSVVWDGFDHTGNRASSGLYFYKAQAGTFVEQKKMLLMK